MNIPGNNSAFSVLLFQKNAKAKSLGSNVLFLFLMFAISLTGWEVCCNITVLWIIFNSTYNKIRKLLQNIDIISSLKDREKQEIIFQTSKNNDKKTLHEKCSYSELFSPNAGKYRPA